MTLSTPLDVLYAVICLVALAVMLAVGVGAWWFAGSPLRSQDSPGATFTHLEM